MKKTLFRDAFLATLLVFLAFNLPALLVANIPFFAPLHSTLKRIQKEYEHVFPDLTQSGRSARRLEADTLIYLVNIDTLDRTGIAELIENIHQYDPKVIGIDVVFNGKNVSFNPSLANALKAAADKSVMGTYLVTNPHGGLLEQPERTDSVYLFGKEGFANLVTREAKSTVRLFLPQFYPDYSSVSDTDSARTQESFATQIVKKFDAASYGKFITHRQEASIHSPEIIVYQRQEKGYRTFQPPDFYEGNLELKRLKGKIVLIGLLGDSTVLEDKHYSPFGNSAQPPDMNGLVIHANIIEMILRHDYVRHADGWVINVVSFTLCFLLMAFFMDAFAKQQLQFHLVSRLIQLVLVLLTFGIGLWIFDTWQIKIDTLKIIIPIVLLVDILYIYKTLALWLRKNYDYQTYF
ncbi:CHASE2 domain-containing protein [Runella sp.]|jgi:CHASE2 domain-containing sensor protein|uniref:CHASE2 domain-containing protein n=1 Tax=Runella sp. TaxID=1960881 RepID=UPI0026063B9E|nr:CHASE2 domain-containing protein [Runella sp.]